jgi:tetraacyldisaccharide 4'-kinase
MIPFLNNNFNMMLRLKDDNLELRQGLVYIFQKMKLLIKPVSFVNQTGCRIKRLLYQAGVFHAQEVPVPVISVGNIRMGGSGKTPLVINLLSFLLDKGKKPAMVTRGYKGLWEQKGGILSDGKSIMGDWRSAGDEPYMVAKRLPSVGIFIGKDRYSSCLEAVKLGFDTVVLDDGFQHLRLKRNLDIVLHNPLENADLREPVSALNRADILLVSSLHGSPLKETLTSRFPNIKIFGYNVTFQGIYTPGKDKPLSVEAFSSKRLIVFSGIADPSRFHILLKNEGIRPLFTLDFHDHHSYPESTLSVLRKHYIRNHADALITTEKDIAKLSGSQSLEDIPLYYIKIDLDIDKAFYHEVLTIL